MHDTMLQQLFNARVPSGYGGCFYGVYVAQVVDIKDPDGQGRVKVKLPWSPDGGDSEYQAWARVGTLMAGNNQGTWFIPDENDEVLIVFNAGDTRHPYVIGSLWNGQDAPPESMDGSGQNNIKTIQSRNGVRVSLDDSNGQESLTLETPGGQFVFVRSLVISDNGMEEFFERLFRDAGVGARIVGGYDPLHDEFLISIFRPDELQPATPLYVSQPTLGIAPVEDDPGEPETEGED